jgi:hypothetical protein
MRTADELREQAWRCLTASKTAADRASNLKLVDEAVELAERAGQLESTIADAGAGQQVSYRIYLLNAGHIVSGLDFRFDSDEAALSIAYAIHGACSDEYGDFELWQGLRQVAGNVSVRGPRPAEDHLAISARAQDCVLSLEETLLFSRRAIAESQRLLARTQQLPESLKRKRSAASS